MSTLEQSYTPAEVRCGSVEDALVALNAKPTSLSDRLKSSFQAIFLGANREPSAWLALSAEYGPDEPITQAVWSGPSSARLQHYVDHYRTRP
jgi:hypothetical protein